MSVIITGDCHGDFSRFEKASRNAYKSVFNDAEYVIVCGDFGLLWTNDDTFRYNMNCLSRLPFTILWIAGNHDNYDMIEDYPIEMWHGGKVRHIVRDKIILLERGQIFDLNGKKYFTFGGASSHDISDGILDPSEFKNEMEFRTELIFWKKTKQFWRIKGLSWWEQELPTDDEIEEAMHNLKEVNNKVDYIITHCCSSELEEQMEFYNHDKLTDFFNYVERFVTFDKWYFGHYHRDIEIDDKHTLLYIGFDKIV